ncbi:MAG: hypothetical protein AAB870_01230 [Patescibacteria group bacterium]
MNYFFILGNHPELSLAEISAVLRSENIAHTIEVVSSDATTISSDSPLNLKTICNRLGGTIKAGVILDTISDDPETIYDYLITHLSETPQEKTVFGISAYTLARGTVSNKPILLSPKGIERLGLSIKKELKSQGGVVRFAMPQQGHALSSVVVEKQHLTDEGNAEFVLLFNAGKWVVGRTEWVQPFEQYSERDWDRPAKSMDVGMLPPKVAQIMINMAGVSPSPDTVLLDPFCGLGTVLQEGWLMGFRNFIGSDLEIKNIESTEKNLLWLEKQNPETVSPTSLRLFQSDVRHLAKEITANSIDCIVTEPFLGPIVNNKTPQARIQTIQKELAELYIESFKVFKDILKPDGVVSIIFPSWNIGGQTIELPIIDAIQKMGFRNETFPEELDPFMSPSKRESLMYSRAGQTVMRELFVWRKK